MQPLHFLFSCFAIFLVFACGEPEPQVEQLPAPGSISELVRSPVTAEGLRDTTQLPRFVFDQTVYDFGTVTEGTVVEYAFDFTNVGPTPLVITDARSNCGCTVPVVPEGPIAPGARERIEVRFNTADKTGDQNKPVRLTANTYPTQTTVYLRGTVLPKTE